MRFQQDRTEISRRHILSFLRWKSCDLTLLDFFVGLCERQCLCIYQVKAEIPNLCQKVVGNNRKRCEVCKYLRSGLLNDVVIHLLCQVLIKKKKFHQKNYSKCILVTFIFEVAKWILYNVINYVIYIMFSSFYIFSYFWLHIILY